MLLLRAGDPIIPLDAVGAGLQLPRDFGDVARRPPGDLNVGVRAHLIKRTFDDRADAMNFLQVVLLRAIRVLGMTDLKTQLVGRPVRPRDHMAAIAAYTKRGADFDQPFPETRNFLFLLAHHLGLTLDLRLKRLQLDDPLFECGNRRRSFLQQLLLLRQFRKTAILRRVGFRGREPHAGAGPLLAELDFQPMDLLAPAPGIRHVLAELIQFSKLAIGFSQMPFELEELLFPSCEFWPASPRGGLRPALGIGDKAVS